MAKYKEPQNPSFRIDHDEANRLVVGLFNNRRYRHSAYIFLALNFGLRYSDTSRISWSDILNSGKKPIRIIEKKTGKVAERIVQPNVKAFIESCYQALDKPDIEQPILLSQKSGNISSIQSMNMTAKNTWIDLYNIDISRENFSQHSFRKTSAWSKYQQYGIVAAQHWLNHSSTDTTNKYLQIKRSEVAAMTADSSFNCLPA